MKRVAISLLIATTAAAAACGSTGTDTDPSHASSQEIADCKDSCDQLKFFGCEDAMAQAECYDDCGNATSDQIELFTACVKSDTCDATCSTHIQPSSHSSGSGSNSGGGCEGTSCNTGDSCKDACGTLQFFSCIDAAALSACNAQCDVAASSDKETFASCVSGGGSGSCSNVDCYYQFDPSAVPGPTPKQIQDCKTSCSDLGFFDCLTGSEAAACAAACDSLTRDQIEAFLVCTQDPTDCNGAIGCF